MALPTFSRMIPDTAIDREIFPMPSWKCFCCVDTGSVSCPQVDEIIAGCKWNIDTPILCQRAKCT